MRRFVIHARGDGSRFGQDRIRIGGAYIEYFGFVVHRRADRQRSGECRMLSVYLRCPFIQPFFLPGRPNINPPFALLARSTFLSDQLIIVP